MKNACELDSSSENITFFGISSKLHCIFFSIEPEGNKTSFSCSNFENLEIFAILFADSIETSISINNPFFAYFKAIFKSELVDKNSLYKII